MTRKLVVSLVPCVALVACVQVLGLEEATLDQGTQGSQPSSAVARSRLSCEDMPGPNCGCEDTPTPACTECLNGCGGAVERCTMDDVCRAELDAYAICLGSSCGGDQEECARSELSDPVLLNCVATCADDCARTKLVTPCELYCACMDSFCSGELAQVGVSDCLAACRDLDEERRDCRRDHCEWGQGDSEHCQHASDRMVKCESLMDLPVETRRFCTDGKESRWACDQNSECCSDSCLQGACR